MEITSRKSGSVDILELQGRLDIAGAEFAESYFYKKAKDAGDLKDCRFVMAWIISAPQACGCSSGS